MTHHDQDGRLRRYLLGSTSDDEAAAIEQEYCDRVDVLDRVRATEDVLIEDYLANRLEAGERERFERHYLAAPHHRTRVAVARALAAAAAVHGARSETGRRGWLE